MWPLLKNPRIFHSGQVTHYNEKSSYFSTRQVTYYNVTTFEKSLYFSTGQVTHYNVTTFEKSSYFSTGQVTHYNVTNLRNPRIFQASGRLPGTIRPLAKFFAFFYHPAGCPKQFDPFKKKQKNKKGESSSKWLVSWFLHLSVKVVCQSTVFKTKKKKEAKVLSVSTFLYKFTTQS